MSLDKKRLELLLPSQIKEERDNLPLIFIPIAPLEWHGPHLPFGTDPLTAHHLCLELAKDIGGVVHPPLYLGTDIIRSPTAVKCFGFKKYCRIMGMDFPGFPVVSFYWKESVFKSMVREMVKVCQRAGYKYIVLMSGHGGENHTKIMSGMAKDMTTSQSKVIYFISFWTRKGPMKDIGHADKYETSVILKIYPSLVALNKLPRKFASSRGDFACRQFGCRRCDGGERRYFTKM